MEEERALSPTLESMTVSPVELDFPLTIESYVAHPFNPWGPIIKFYVRFTVNQVRHLVFPVNGQSESRSFELEPASIGVVLASEHEGGTNLCIWSGLIIDGLVSMGLDPEMAKGVAKAVNEWIIDGDRSWRHLKNGIDVEMRVATTVLVSSAHPYSAHSTKDN